MKPFDIELAKAGHPVCTRDGHKARIVCFDKKGCLQIVALIQRADGNEYVSIYDVNGKDVVSDGSFDLMMASEKKSGWINIHNINGNVAVDGVFSSEEDAREYGKDSSSSYVSTTKIEWEE